MTKLLAMKFLAPNSIYSIRRKRLRKIFLELFSIWDNDANIVSPINNSKKSYTFDYPRDV